MTTVRPNYHQDPSLDALYRSSAAEALSAYRRTVSDESSSCQEVVKESSPSSSEEEGGRGASVVAGATLSSSPATVSDVEDGAPQSSSSGQNEDHPQKEEEEERNNCESNSKGEETPKSHPLEGITRPGPNDVLCGRGHGANNHRGNVRFRNLLKYYKLRYVAAWKAEKPKVAREVVNVWRAMDPPGRFLIQSPDKKNKSPSDSTSSSLDDDEKKKKSKKNAAESRGAAKLSYAHSSVWHDVGDKRAQEKTSQTLRERNADLLSRLSEAVGCAGGGGSDERQRQVLEAIRRTHRPPELSPKGIKSLSDELDKCSASNAELTKEEIASAAARALLSIGEMPEPPRTAARDVEMKTPKLGAGTSATAAPGQTKATVATLLSPTRRSQEPLLDQSSNTPRGSLDLLAVVAGAGEGIAQISQQTSPLHSRDQTHQAAARSPRLRHQYEYEQHQLHRQQAALALPPLKRRRTEPHSFAPENDISPVVTNPTQLHVASNYCRDDALAHRKETGSAPYEIFPRVRRPYELPQEPRVEGGPLHAGVYDSSLPPRACLLPRAAVADPSRYSNCEEEEQQLLAAAAARECLLRQQHQQARARMRDILVRRASLSTAVQAQQQRRRLQQQEQQLVAEAVAARRASNAGFGGYYASTPAPGRTLSSAAGQREIVERGPDRLAGGIYTEEEDYAASRRYGEDLLVPEFRFWREPHY